MIGLNIPIPQLRDDLLKIASCLESQVMHRDFQPPAHMGIIELIKRPQGPSPAAQPKEELFVRRQRQVPVDRGKHGVLVFRQLASDFFEEVDVVCDL